MIVTTPEVGSAERKGLAERGVVIGDTITMRRAPIHKVRLALFQKRRRIGPVGYVGNRNRRSS